MRDILVRAHDDHAAALAIDAPHVEDVLVTLQVRAEHLFIVAKTVTTFRGPEESGHVLDLQLTMALLKHGPDVDDGVDILSFGRVSPDRRLRGLAEKFA